MKQLGLLGFDIRLQRIHKAGDPMVTLNEKEDWEILRPMIEKARPKGSGQGGSFTAAIISRNQSRVS